MSQVRFKIVLVPVAREMLLEIQDRRVRDELSNTIDRLAVDPEKQGKPLTGELNGYRSLRAVGQRYRIIYKVERSRILVIILGVGIRKEGDRGDIYRRLQKLLRLKLI